jgi:hypothetical protein
VRVGCCLCKKHVFNMKYDDSGNRWRVVSIGDLLNAQSTTIMVVYGDAYGHMMYPRQLQPGDVVAIEKGRLNLRVRESTSPGSPSERFIAHLVPWWCHAPSRLGVGASLTCTCWFSLPASGGLDQHHENHLHQQHGSVDVHGRKQGVVGGMSPRLVSFQLVGAWLSTLYLPYTHMVMG